MLDTIITNGTVVDGTGMAAYRADVGIENGTITELGALAGRAARKVIDAEGMVVAPGFVDPHTHLDPQLCWDPLALPLALHGVTTVLVGNCSLTLAPVRPEHHDGVARMFHFIEEIPISTLDEGIPWEWRSFGEYLGHMDGRLGINCSALVGHSSLRYYAMGAEALDRAATDDEIEVMRVALEEAIGAGAAGLSTSHLKLHVADDGKPIPSRLATHDELVTLCDVLGRANRGVIQSDGGIDLPHRAQWVDETLRPLALRTGRTILGGPAFQSPNSPGAWQDILAMTAKAQREGARIYMQASPRQQDLYFTFENVIVFNEFASWNRVMGLGREERLRAFADPGVRDEMQFDAVASTVPSSFHRDWSRVQIAVTQRPENEHLRGRSVLDVARERGCREIDVLLDLAIDEDMATLFESVGHANADPEAVAAMLRSPQTIMGSSDAGAHVNMFCGAGDTSLLLSHWVRETGMLRLEEAVRMITMEPALVLGLHDRGVLREGYAADITLFDRDGIGYLPERRVNDLPGGAARLYRDATGIGSVLVNGVEVVADGAPTGELGGMALRNGR